MSFFSKLKAASQANDSLLCVGLDPRLDRLPSGYDIEENLTQWGAAIIDQTKELVCCYKPNFAFYEQAGPQGLCALQRTIQHIPQTIPVLLDVKRGDIGSTADAYARAAFEQWGADGVTLNAYLGQDSVVPFLNYTGKAVFVLCYTSNPSAAEVQEYGDPPLYQHIASLASEWGNEEQIGFVVGATQPTALQAVRCQCPDNWILAPGIGAQGGDLEQTLRVGLRPDKSGLIIPVSRGIIFEADVRQAADAIRIRINQERGKAVHKIEMVEDEQVDLIKGLFEAGCVQFGNFTLASGKKSPVYIDIRRVVSFPQVFRKVAWAYSRLVEKMQFDTLAGVPYAALPVAAVVAASLGVPLIYPRKEVKDHGIGRSVEGSFALGQRAVLLEDVITSGGSIVAAAQTLKTAGLRVSDVVVLVDREQGGGAELQKNDLKLHAIVSMQRILDVLMAEGLVDNDTTNFVKKYLRGESAG